MGRFHVSRNLRSLLFILSGLSMSAAMGCAGVDATYEVCREANGTACVECHFHEHDGEASILVHEVSDAERETETTGLR